MNCPKCGKENPEGSSFCLYCGNPMDVDTTISFETLNRSHSVRGPMQQLWAEANRAKTFGILSLVFSCLGGILGLIFAIMNITRVNSVNRLNFFPEDVMEIDEYEAAKKKLNGGRKMSVIGLIIFAGVTVISFIVTYILALNGIEVYTVLAEWLYKV